MPTKDPDVQLGLINWFLAGIAVTFAVIGGMARYLSDIQEGKAVFSWLSFISQGVVSAFAGSIATLYLMEYQFSPYMIVLGSGLFGFGGIAILRFVMKQIYNRISNTQIQSSAGGKNER